VTLRIHSGCRPNRIPQSEFLVPVGRLGSTEIPITNKAKLKCSLDEDTLFDLSDLILISEISTTIGEFSQIYWLKDSASLVPVPDIETLTELYKEASRALEKGVFIRSLATDFLGIKKAVSPTIFNAIITRKQLNVLTAKSLIEDRVIKFFNDRKKFKNGNKKILAISRGGDHIGVRDGESGVFENALINKKIRKGSTQTDISEMFKKAVEDGTSFEDMMYNGRRQRRLFGTAFTSHRLPVIGREDLFDSPLFSHG